MAPVEAVVETRALSKRYGARVALDRLDLTVPRGSVFGLLGRNGAGKSTTMRLLLGLATPSGGEVRLFGRPLARERLALLGRVGAQVESPAFYPFLSGAANLAELAALSGGAAPGRVGACLERVALGDRGGDLYRGYSTGMRQRLAIAAALLHDPELVVLDEPTAGLDPPAVRLVRDLIRALARDEGKTVIVSSHVLHEVELVCDRVAVLEAGRVVTQGEVRELVAQQRVVVLVETPDVERALAAARGVEGAGEAAAAEGGLRVELAAGREAALNRALVEAGVAVAAFVPRRPTLEDLFHTLVREGPA